MHLNTVSHVRTIDRGARELGEDVDFHFDVSSNWRLENGVIWVRGVDDESLMTFPDFGVDSRIRLTCGVATNFGSSRRSGAGIAPGGFLGPVVSWEVEATLVERDSPDCSRDRIRIPP